jgi:sarcosine oxidase delta subunit
MSSMFTGVSAGTYGQMETNIGNVQMSYMSNQMHDIRGQMALYPKLLQTLALRYTATYNWINSGSLGFLVRVFRYEKAIEVDEYSVIRKTIVEFRSTRAGPRVINGQRFGRVDIDAVQVQTRTHSCQMALPINIDDLTNMGRNTSQEYIQKMYMARLAIHMSALVTGIYDDMLLVAVSTLIINSTPHHMITAYEQDPTLSRIRDVRTQHQREEALISAAQLVARGRGSINNGTFRDVLQSYMEKQTPIHNTSQARDGYIIALPPGALRAMIASGEADPSQIDISDSEARAALNETCKHLFEVFGGKDNFIVGSPEGVGLSKSGEMTYEGATEATESSPMAEIKSEIDKLKPSTTVKVHAINGFPNVHAIEIPFINHANRPNTGNKQMLGVHSASFLYHYCIPGVNANAGTATERGIHTRRAFNGVEGTPVLETNTGLLPAHFFGNKKEDPKYDPDAEWKEEDQQFNFTPLDHVFRPAQNANITLAEWIAYVGFWAEVEVHPNAYSNTNGCSTYIKALKNAIRARLDKQMQKRTRTKEIHFRYPSIPDTERDDVFIDDGAGGLATRNGLIAGFAPIPPADVAGAETDNVLDVAASYDVFALNVFKLALVAWKRKYTTTQIGGYIQNLHDKRITSGGAPGADADNTDQARALSVMAVSIAVMKSIFDFESSLYARRLAEYVEGTATADAIANAVSEARRSDSAVDRVLSANVPDVSTMTDKDARNAVLKAAYNNITGAPAVRAKVSSALQTLSAGTSVAGIVQSSDAYVHIAKLVTDLHGLFNGIHIEATGTPASEKAKRVIAALTLSGASARLGVDDYMNKDIMDAFNKNKIQDAVPADLNRTQAVDYYATFRADVHHNLGPGSPVSVANYELKTRLSGTIFAHQDMTGLVSVFDDVLSALPELFNKDMTKGTLEEMSAMGLPLPFDISVVRRMVGRVGHAILQKEGQSIIAMSRFNGVSGGDPFGKTQANQLNARFAVVAEGVTTIPGAMAYNLLPPKRDNLCAPKDFYKAATNRSREKNGGMAVFTLPGYGMMLGTDASTVSLLQSDDGNYKCHDGMRGSQYFALRTSYYREMYLETVSPENRQLEAHEFYNTNGFAPTPARRRNGIMVVGDTSVDVRDLFPSMNASQVCPAISTSSTIFEGIRVSRPIHTSQLDYARNPPMQTYLRADRGSTVSASTGLVGPATNVVIPV